MLLIHVQKFYALLLISIFEFSPKAQDNEKDRCSRKLRWIYFNENIKLFIIYRIDVN